MARNFQSSSTGLTMSINSLTYPLTISAWFRDTNGDANDRNIVQIGDTGSSNNYFRISKTQGSTALTIRDSAGGSFATTSTGNTYTANTWNHGLSQHTSATSHSITLNNGTTATSGANAGTPSSIDEIAIGYENDTSPGDSWEGDMAEVGVWDVDLTAGEIAALASGFSPQFIRPANLVMYAPLRGGIANGNDRAIAGTEAGILTDSAGNIGLSEHPRIIIPGASTPAFKGSAVATIPPTNYYKLFLAGAA